MTALLILLTPVLLLAIVALFGFVGCSFTPSAGIKISPVVESAIKGTQSISATLSLNGGELLVATLQWGGSATPQFSGVQLQADSAVNNGNALTWNGMNIQVFTGKAPGAGGNVTVTVTLQTASPVQWSLCIWPYATSSQTLYGAVNKAATFTGAPLIIQAPAVNVNKGDAFYAAAFAADTPATPGGQGAFPGSNSLSAPNGFSTATDSSNDPLLEGLVATSTGPVIAQATNTPTDTHNTKPEGFILALGVTITS